MEWLRAHTKSTKRAALLLLSVALIVAIRVFTTIELHQTLQDTITLALGILYEAFPFLVLGVLISVTIQQFVSQRTILKLLPKKSFFRRPLLASIGVLLPVCECGNVPLARGLIMKGLKPHEVLTFLFAAPIINPVTIFTTLQAFPDARVTILRVVAAFFIAIAVGSLFTRFTRKQIITESFQTYCDDHAHQHSKTVSPFSRKAIAAFSRSTSDELTRLLPSLIAGSLVAGVIQTTIPRSLLTTLSTEPVVAILTLLILAFIISICANVDAFFALSLSTIFPISAIIAFLVFGPMIDIKMLALLRTTFTSRVLLISSVFIFLASFLTGLVVAYAF